MGLHWRSAKNRGDGVSMYGGKAAACDSVYGAHIEGDEIVLSESLGGMRFKAVRMDPESVSGVAKGSFRLFLQPTSVTGALRGDMMMSAEPIGRDLISEIIGMDESMGMLGVYTPSREDALQMMVSVTGDDPFEYGFSVPFLSADYQNFRQHHGTVPSGTMVLFGSITGDVKSFGNDPKKVLMRDMDRVYGFHPDKNSIILSTDLGGGRYRFVPFDDRGDADADSIRMIIDSSGLTDQRIGIRSTMISEQEISHELAVRICKDRTRCGVLCVYVADRGHAYGLATEILEGRKPKDSSKDAIPYLCGGRGSPTSSKVFYGPVI